MKTEQIDRGKSDALHLLHQSLQLCAEAGGLGFVIMHDGVFKQCVQPLDFLNLSSIARKSEGGSYLSAVALA